MAHITYKIVKDQKALCPSSAPLFVPQAEATGERPFSNRVPMHQQHVVKSCTSKTMLQKEPPRTPCSHIDISEASLAAKVYPPC